MKLALVDAVSVGILCCAVVLTGVTVKREFANHQPRPAVTKVTPRPELSLVGHSMGDVNASVPIVVFADFQCPYCAQAQPLVKQMLAEYPREVRFIYRHLPFQSVHPYARTAALAAECAGAQGAFVDYHDLLYSRQDSIGIIPWKDFAARAGVLSSAEFEACLAEERYIGEIERDILLAQDLEIDRTPTFVIGDAAYAGVPPSDWIRNQIALTRSSAAGGRK